MAQETRAQLTHRLEVRRAEAKEDEELVRDLQIGIDAMTQAKGEVADRAKAKAADADETKRQIDKLR